MPKYKVKAKVLVTKETEITADNHDKAKKALEAEMINEGFTDAQITYIKTTVIPDDDDELDYELDLFDLPNYP